MSFAFKSMAKSLLLLSMNCHCKKISKYVTTASKLRNFSTILAGRDTIPHRVLFFGTDEFALTCLKKIQLNQPEELHVVTILSKQKSRSPVLKYAQDNKLPAHCWPSIPNLSQFDIGTYVCTTYYVYDISQPSYYSS